MSRPAFNSAFPLARRTDLSEHERRTPADVLARLDAAIADARAGNMKRLDPKWLEPEDD